MIFPYAENIREGMTVHHLIILMVDCHYENGLI